MFNRLKTYVPVATFLVLVVSLCYLEFPVVTGLIILILVVLYLCFNDGIGGKKKPLFSFGKTDSLLIPGNLQKQSFGVLESVAGKSENNRARFFLAGLKGFCPQVEGRAGWRHPFLIGKAKAAVKATLQGEGLFCGDPHQWLNDCNFAKLSTEVTVERSGRASRLVVKMAVLGKVEVNRAETSICDQTVLWHNSVQRMTVGQLEATLKEALEACFDALLRDYLSETHKAQSVNLPTAPKLLPWKISF